MTRRVYSKWYALAVAVCGWSATTPAGAQESDVATTLEKAVAASNTGAFTEAIHLYEQMSDRGFRNADASANRALAYLQRADSPKHKPGDLGQAVAALREAQLLGDHGSEVPTALEAVRQEISRQRARHGEDPVIVQPRLGRAFVSLLPEHVWAILALIGSLILSAGLLVWFLRDATKRLPGQIAAGTGLLLLSVFGSSAALARSYRTSSMEAIVVAREATLLDNTGKRLKGKALDVEASAIPLGASLYVLGQQGQLYHVEWGSLDAWVRSGQIRILQNPYAGEPAPDGSE